MEGCWVTQFPNWNRPATVPGWTFFSTLEVIRYNLIPIGQTLAGFVVVGGISVMTTVDSSRVLMRARTFTLPLPS